MSGTEPGRAAYEVWAGRSAGLAPYRWDDKPNIHEFWREIAQAAVRAAELTWDEDRERDEARAVVAEVIGEDGEFTAWRQRAGLGPPAAVSGTACRHCGGEIVPCGRVLDGGICKGWNLTQFIDSMPIGAHYCGGRSVNPSAEPATEGAAVGGTEHLAGEET